MRGPPQVVRNIRVEQFDRMYHINGLAIYDDGWKGWVSEGYADFFTFPHVKLKPVFGLSTFYRILRFARSVLFNEPGNRIVYILLKIQIKGANILY